MVSIGCPKNLVDSEVMLGTLQGSGYALTRDPAEADVIVVNTCTFIGPARQESVDTILEMAEHKRTGRCRRLVVAGCLVQQNHDELQATLPEVDAFVGLNDIERIAEACALSAGSRFEASRGVARYLYTHDSPRLLATPGCSRRCDAEAAPPATRVSSPVCGPGCPGSPCAPRSSSVSPARPNSGSARCCASSMRRSSIMSACSPTRRRRAPPRRACRTTFRPA